MIPTTFPSNEETKPRGVHFPLPFSRDRYPLPRRNPRAGKELHPTGEFLLSGVGARKASIDRSYLDARRNRVRFLSFRKSRSSRERKEIPSDLGSFPLSKERKRRSGRGFVSTHRSVFEPPRRCIVCFCFRWRRGEVSPRTEPLPFERKHRKRIGAVFGRDSFS